MNPLHVKWRERAIAAAQQYAAAAAYSYNAILEQKDQSCPEASEAVKQALRFEDLARSRYREALDIFARLVLDGIEPPDEEQALTGLAREEAGCRARDIEPSLDDPKLRRQRRV